MFDAAERLGMDVFVTTDMQWCTPPLCRYAGELTAGNPRLAVPEGARALERLAWHARRLGELAAHGDPGQAFVARSVCYLRDALIQARRKAKGARR